MSCLFNFFCYLPYLSYRGSKGVKVYPLSSVKETRCFTLKDCLNFWDCLVCVDCFTVINYCLFMQCRYPIHSLALNADSVHVASIRPSLRKTLVCPLQVGELEARVGLFSVEDLVDWKMEKVWWLDCGETV